MSAKICKSHHEKVWQNRFKARGPRPKEQLGSYTGSRFTGWSTRPEK